MNYPNLWLGATIKDIFVQSSRVSLKWKFDSDAARDRKSSDLAGKCQFPWPFPWIYARKDILFLDADIPSSLKLQVLSFELKYFCCWWMEQWELTIHFKSLSGWICTLLSQHLAHDPKPWVPLLLSERERKHKLAQGGSGVSLATNQCWVRNVPHTGLTHYRTTGSLKKVSKTYDYRIRILLWMITWIKYF